MPEVVLGIDPQVRLHADRSAAWEGRFPETFREDHQRMVERSYIWNGSLCPDGARLSNISGENITHWSVFHPTPLEQASLIPYFSSH